MLKWSVAIHYRLESANWRLGYVIHSLAVLDLLQYRQLCLKYRCRGTICHLPTSFTYRFPKVVNYNCHFIFWEWSKCVQILRRTAHCLTNLLTFYLLTYLLTYSMQHSPSWEANQLSASQEIPRILWKTEDSLPHLQVPATCPYLEPARSSPFPYIPLP